MQTLTTIRVLPENPHLTAGTAIQFTALCLDQDGAPMANQPPCLWSTTTGVISAAGKLTAGSDPGEWRVYAALEDLSVGGSTVVTVVTSGVPADVIAAMNALRDTIARHFP
jgi:hypothetical protein